MTPYLTCEFLRSVSLNIQSFGDVLVFLLLHTFIHSFNAFDSQWSESIDFNLLRFVEIYFMNKTIIYFGKCATCT